MFEALKRQKTLLGALALIIVPLVVYRANASDPTRRPPLDRLVLFVTSPLEAALSWTVASVSDVWSSYVDVRGARAENIELRREQLRNQREMDALAGLVEENGRLRTILGLSERNPKLEMVAARVIAVSTSPFERTVRVDRGLTSKVARGMTVLSDRGLVGRVQRAGYSWADVVLIADEKMSLDVAFGRTRVRGRMHGSGLWPSGRVEILDVLRTDDVRVGDVISTSGLAGVFPPGIPVALVTKVDAVPGGGQLLIEAEPLVDLERVDEVAVVVGPNAADEPMITPENLLPIELQASRTSSTSTRAGP